MQKLLCHKRLAKGAINMKNCSICNKKIKHRNICTTCRKRILISECHFCNFYGEIIKLNNKNYCKNCQKCYFEKCEFCNKFYIINKLIDNKNICNSCYKNLSHSPPCSRCGETYRIEQWINKIPFCKKCYQQPIKECYVCGKQKIVCCHSENGTICQSCHQTKKRNQNESYRIKHLLRTRLNSAFRDYSKNGKIKKSYQYNINFYEIAIFLGPCPGNREDYHIDHIFPLSAFNFDDPIEIKIAFSPKNHQWLTKHENLIKGDKYNKQEFEEFLSNEKTINHLPL